MLFDWAFAWEILPQLGRAAVITIEATVIGFVLAATLGLMLALLRRSRRWWISWPAAGFIEAVRSTPLLVQIYFMFFIFPEYGVSMPALVTGILGLGLHYSAYTSEV